MIFETSNFLIRDFQLTDSHDLNELLSDKEVMKYIGDGHFDITKTSPEEMIKWFLKTCDNENGYGTWAIESKSSCEVVGNCHISFSVPANCTEFGIALKQIHWGKEYALEISKGIIKYVREMAFGELVGICHVGNSSSKKLMTKLGFKFDRKILQYGVEQEVYVLDKLRISL